ncbi:MAG: hypothetical protein ACOCVN_00700 [bacterium]
MIDKNKTIEILNLLANGIDPMSGEIFPANSPYQQAEVVRALFNACALLKDVKVKKPKEIPPRQGTPWAEEEDKKLAIAFQDNTPIKELANIHQRSTGAIKSRLQKHGLVDGATSFLFIKNKRNN